MRELRAQFDVGPVAIHASYLINVCSQTETVRTNSVAAFRGEVERALALNAEFLVLHPGSWKGLTRDEGLRLAAESIEAPSPASTSLARTSVSSSRTPPARSSPSAESWSRWPSWSSASAPARPSPSASTPATSTSPATTSSPSGLRRTMQQVGATLGFDTVSVWHCNDAKAAFGSKLDRHQHIGEGTIGAAPFRRLLHDPRFAHCAFIAETPVDEPGDEARNVAALKALAAD